MDCRGALLFPPRSNIDAFTHGRPFNSMTKFRPRNGAARKFRHRAQRDARMISGCQQASFNDVEVPLRDIELVQQAMVFGGLNTENIDVSIETRAVGVVAVPWMI